MGIALNEVAKVVDVHVSVTEWKRKRLCTQTPRAGSGGDMHTVAEGERGASTSGGGAVKGSAEGSETVGGNSKGGGSTSGGGTPA